MQLFLKEDIVHLEDVIVEFILLLRHSPYISFQESQRESLKALLRQDNFPLPFPPPGNKKRNPFTQTPFLHIVNLVLYLARSI